MKIFGKQINWPVSVDISVSGAKNLDESKPQRAEVISKVMQRVKSRARKDIKNWQQARQQAERIFMPRRHRLYALYDDVIIDNHLASLVTTRKLKTLGERFKIVDKDSGDADMEKTSLLRRPWFYEFLEMSLDSKFFGHSLIEFGDIRDDEFVSIELVPREHVVPQEGIVLLNISDTKGIPFREPPYERWLIEVGKQKDLGLLFKAAVNMLYKKNVQAAWSEFAEIFGMPLRVGKTSSRDKEHWAKIETMLKDMGTAAYGLFPEGTEVEFVEAKSRGDASSVYAKFIDLINAELSKLILGQTMLTDDGSSRSQSEVHERLARDYIEADKRFLFSLINFRLLPFLQLHGYPFTEQDEFHWDDDVEMDMKDRWTIDQGLLQEFEIDEQYFIDKYGVPITGRKQASPVADPDNPEAKKKIGGFPAPDARRLKTLNLNIPSYDHCCPEPIRYNQNRDALEKIEEQLLSQAKQGAEFDQAWFAFTTDELIRGLHDGWSLDGIDYNAPDHTKRALMELNLFRFGGAKTAAGMIQLNEMLRDSKNFSEFRRRSRPLLTNYNQNWMMTEFNTARTTARNAANFNRHLRQSDLFPYGEYRTIGDDRVREAHRALNGRMFRIDDPAMDVIYPPNGWNCRCQMIPRGDLEGKRLTSKSEAIQTLQLNNSFSKMTKDGFDINRGKADVIFRENQLYMKRFNINKLGREAAGVNAFRTINRQELPEIRLKKRDKQWANTFFASLRGGFDLDDAKKVRLLDYNKKPVHLTRKSMQRHLKGERIAQLERVPEIILDPDEVWFQRDRDAVIRYIKFYKDKPMNVVVKIEDGEFRISSWHDLDVSTDDAIKKLEENKRAGLLIKQKSRQGP